MVVGVAKIELFIPEPNSLKAKRQVLKALTQKIEAKFRKVSLAEVDGHDLWQRAVLGISVVGKDQKLVDSKINDILSFIQKDGRLEIINAEIDFINY
ncbi:DUF503 domain-containing protein [Thermodesulfobacterium sp. TA1]|uniref:DUF503 domain-containing protein n=1 Tax=Thermodesulfobacterium sp. TA1 TaxID=2234087 RepID=UPI001231A01E|nr:DUF503 domain-containing protein [Thermodesulfobacterium sp. TA1]QER42049.1 DUF503 domain-containing protein [Thermodesulfobacterium sp. TA1]